MTGHRVLHDAYVADYSIEDIGSAGEIMEKVDRQFGVVELVTAGSETRTLADPAFVGQVLTLTLQTDGGDCAVTAASDVTATAGQNVMTFSAVGETVQLVGIRDTDTTFAWRAVENLNGIVYS